jgi:hypothetical protein
MHSGGRRSTGEFLTYFCCIFIIIDVVTFTVCFSLQEKYKDGVVKRHGEGFDWQNEPIDGQAVYANGGRKARGHWDAVFCLTLWMRDTVPYYYWLLFLRYALFDGVVESREAMLSRGSSSSQSSGLISFVSQIHLNYEVMKNQLRTTQDVLKEEQEDHRVTRVIGYLQCTDASIYGDKK